jgi:hypothetical protein
MHVMMALSSICQSLSRSQGDHPEKVTFVDVSIVAIEMTKTSVKGGNKHICKVSRRASSHSPHSSTSSSSNGHERRISNITSQLTDYIQNHIAGAFDNLNLNKEEQAAYGYARDYTSLDQNENVVSFVVKKTRNYVYLTCILTNNTITLYETSTDNSSAKFELIKTFWVPGRLKLF